MRKVLLLLVLAAVFTALFSLSRSVASWQHTVISADAGTLIYAATFDGGGGDGFNPDWSQYPGRLAAQIEGGQMQITVGEAVSGAYSVAKPYFGDFDLTVEAQTIAGPLDNAYGIVFRLQNKDNATFEDDSYYLFLISADGYYQLLRVIDGQAPQIVSDWIESPLINQGVEAVNHLRVVARGDQFSFYINDQPVTMCIPDDPTAQSTIHPLTGECMGGQMLETIIDATILNGQIGVAAQSTLMGGEGVVAAFDNVLITAPEAR